MGTIPTPTPSTSSFLLGCRPTGYYLETGYSFTCGPRRNINYIIVMTMEG